MSKTSSALPFGRAHLDRMDQDMKEVYNELQGVQQAIAYLATVCPSTTENRYMIESTKEHIERAAVHARHMVYSTAALVYRNQPANLDAVITAAEAAAIFDVTPAGVRKAIERGALPARKSGSTWLILRADAADLWLERAHTDEANQTAAEFIRANLDNGLYIQNGDYFVWVEETPNNDYIMTWGKQDQPPHKHVNFETVDQLLKAMYREAGETLTTWQLMEFTE